MAIVPGCGGASEAAPATHTLRAFTPRDELCVTEGRVQVGPGGLAIAEPAVRAFVVGSFGDAAALAFTFRGATAQTRKLASGAARRQLGLKLRAANSCNVVYVMWRLDPKPELEVSVKYNPGMRTHKECGASGYTKLEPRAPAPDLEIDSAHALAAEIAGDELTASIDGRVVWRGRLPSTAREIVGPAGLRTDNVAIEISRLAIADGKNATACRRESSD